MRNVIFFVNGVRTWPGRVDNWTGRATTHVLSHPEYGAVAEKVEYFTFAMTRSLLQGRRAGKMIKCMSHFPPDKWDRHVVAHSNGADVAIDAIQRSGEKIKTLLLFSPAIDWDCLKNGLHDIYSSGLVLYAPHLFIAGKDLPLKWAGTFFGKMLGYGYLGLKGPKPGTFGYSGGMPITYEADYGHSDWFNSKNFDATMRDIRRLSLGIEDS